MRDEIVWLADSLHAAVALQGCADGPREHAAGGRTLIRECVAQVLISDEFLQRIKQSFEKVLAMQAQRQGLQY
jgi:hypothetical protein